MLSEKYFEPGKQNLLNCCLQICCCLKICSRYELEAEFKYFDALECFQQSYSLHKSSTRLHFLEDFLYDPGGVKVGILEDLDRDGLLSINFSTSSFLYFFIFSRLSTYRIYFSFRFVMGSLSFFFRGPSRPQLILRFPNQCQTDLFGQTIQCFL